MMLIITTADGELEVHQELRSWVQICVLVSFSQPNERYESNL